MSAIDVLERRRRLLLSVWEVFVKQLLVVLAVVGVLGVTEARAQDRGGVRVGINAATLSVDEEGFDPKVRTGLVVGLFGVVPVNDLFAFQPEVLFSQQGAKVEDGSDEGKIKLDFLQVPLLARFKLGSNSPAHLLVGPSFGFRTKAEVESNGETEDIKDDVERMDVGLVTGVAVNAGPAVVDARYTWGLRNLDKSDDPGNVKSRVFSVSVGIRF
jgi:hypothetical protein